MDYHQLGKKIQFHRLQKGLTQAKLADAIGYTSSYVGQVENGRTKPSLEAVVSIANALDITPDQLLLSSLDHPEVVYMSKIERRLNALNLRSRIAACDMLERLMNIVEDAALK